MIYNILFITIHYIFLFTIYYHLLQVLLHHLLQLAIEKIYYHLSQYSIYYKWCFHLLPFTPFIPFIPGATVLLRGQLVVVFQSGLHWPSKIEPASFETSISQL